MKPDKLVIQDNIQHDSLSDKRFIIQDNIQNDSLSNKQLIIQDNVQNDSFSDKQLIIQGNIQDDNLSQRHQTHEPARNTTSATNIHYDTIPGNNPISQSYFCMEA